MVRRVVLKMENLFKPITMSGTLNAVGNPLAYDVY